jgi:1,4-alpha-glucan branching enzyme
MATPKTTPARGRKKAITSTSLEKSVADTRLEAMKVQVQFSLTAPGAGSVSVAGSFNHWDPSRTPMRGQGDHWTVALELPRGRYEYKFFVDGAWLTDPNATESTRNPFGGSNSVFMV